MPRGKAKTRKTRVTQRDIKAARKDIKMSSYERKRKIIPGPWTEIETKFKVKAEMRFNDKGAMAELLGPSYGSYINRDTYPTEKGWYPIVFNLIAPKMKKLVSEHGIDQFLAASEKALNELRDKTGKPKYGTIILTTMGANHSEKTKAADRFISVYAKTNKKSISGFRAIRKKEYITLP